MASRTESNSSRLILLEGSRPRCKVPVALYATSCGIPSLALIGELDRGEAPHSHATGQAVTVAFLLALAGLAMAIYLISVHSRA